MALLDKMKEYLDKGIEVSKEAFSKAGDAVQDFGDKSVVRIEIKQLESKLNKEYASLGTQVFNLSVISNEKSLSFDDPHVSGIIAEIHRLIDEIDARKHELSRDDQENNGEEVDVAADLKEDGNSQKEQ